MPGELSEAWIALGGNLGDREKNFGRALEALAEVSGIWLKRGSPVYETPPMGPAGQERYWNAVIEVETELNPEELLAACLAVESQLGRVRGERWGSRTIDLDLLLYDDVVWESESLILPHPEIGRRAFVLQPLSNLVPGRMIGGRTVDDLLAVVSREGMIMVRDNVLSCRSSD